MFGFDDEEDGWGFGGGQQQQQAPQLPQMPQMGQGGLDLQNMPLLTKLMLAGHFARGGDPMTALQAVSSMQGTQAKSKYMQDMLALKQQAAARDEEYRKRMMGEIDGGQGGQQPGAPTDNLPDPGAGQWGPPGGAQPGAQPGAQAGAPNPMQQRIDRYRKWADYAAVSGRGEDSKRYADMANELEKNMQGEWSLPQTMMVGGKAVAVQFNAKTGQVRPVEGYDPKANFTAPVASANGLVSMNQDTGEMRETGMGNAPPADVQAYQAAQAQGFKGSFFDYKKAIAQAGSTRVHVTPQIKVGNTLAEDVTKAIAGRAMDNIDLADTGAQSLDTIDSIRQNVGKAITGPLAKERTAWARIKQTIGLGDNATAEQLAATRKTLMGLAQSELEAAKSMKGQGAITDPEREILRRASLGDQSMSPQEIMAATEVAERLARARITQGQKNVGVIKAIPSFQPIFPLLDQRLGDLPPGGRQITPSTLSPKKAAAPASPAAPRVNRMVKRTGKMPDGRTVVEYTDGSREYR